MASSTHHVERKPTHKLYNVKNARSKVHSLLYKMINSYNFLQDPVGENDYNFWLKIRFKCKLTEVLNSSQLFEFDLKFAFFLCYFEWKKRKMFDLKCLYNIA